MSAATEQHERATEAHRNNIADLLNELRERATPGEVFDNVFGSEGGRETVRRLGEQVRGNPLPLALVGVGIAWLLASDGMSRSRNRDKESSVASWGDGNSDGNNETQSMGRRARDMADSASEGWARVKDTAEDQTQSLTQAATDKVQDLKARAQDALDSGSEQARGLWQRTTERARESKDRLADAEANIERLIEEQPLLLAGLGFAIGLAAGALVPMTDTEHALLGEKSDEVKDKARDIVRDEYAQVKEEVMGTASSAVDTLHEKLTPESQPDGENVEPNEIEMGDTRH